MTEPKIIDNQRVNLQGVLKSQALKHSKLSIATGYWDLEATASLLEELDGLEKIRLLIGCSILSSDWIKYIFAHVLTWIKY